jgi:hypothetical protein
MSGRRSLGCAGLACEGERGDAAAATVAVGLHVALHWAAGELVKRRLDQAGKSEIESQ